MKKMPFELEPDGEREPGRVPTTAGDRPSRAEASFTAACEARDADDPMRARALFLETTGLLCPSTHAQLLAAAHVQLGYIARLAQDWGTSEHHSRLAVSIRPASELASLQLFHTLAAQDRWREALEEAARYVALKDSDEYRLIVSSPDAGATLHLPPARHPQSDRV